VRTRNSRGAKSQEYLKQERGQMEKSIPKKHRQTAKLRH